MHSLISRTKMNIKYISLKDSITLFPESNMVIINSHSRSRKKCTVDKNQLFHATKDSTIGGVFCSMCQGLSLTAVLNIAKTQGTRLIVTLMQTEAAQRFETQGCSVVHQAKRIPLFKFPKKCPLRSSLAQANLFEILVQFPIFPYNRLVTVCISGQLVQMILL